MSFIPLPVERVYATAVGYTVSGVVHCTCDHLNACAVLAVRLNRERFFRSTNNALCLPLTTARAYSTSMPACSRTGEGGDRTIDVDD
jgi:hypothetical protein